MCARASRLCFEEFSPESSDAFDSGLLMLLPRVVTVIVVGWFVDAAAPKVVMPSMHALTKMTPQAAAARRQYFVSLLVRASGSRRAHSSDSLPHPNTLGAAIFLNFPLLAL